MAVATGELVQITFVAQQQGQTVENVFMFRERTGASTTSQISQAVRDLWTDYRPMVNAGVTLIELRWKFMTPVQLDSNIIQPNSGQNQGGHSNNVTNTMLAQVTTHRTGTAGKRHRGRTYMFGVTSESLTDNWNKFDSTFMTLAQTQWDLILTHYGDASGTNAYLAFGIYSRLIGGTSPYTVAGWQAVTQCVPHVIVATQRRRREGVGI